MIIKEDFDLTCYNSYRIPAKCRRAFLPETEEDIYNLISRDQRNVTIIGRGNNIILAKEYYNRDFLILSDSFSQITISGDQVFSLAGTDMYDLSIKAYENSLKGFEFFYDIPSSLGGAIVMNAGSNDIEVSDFLRKVKIISTLTGEVTYLAKEDLKFKYRSSIFQGRSDLLILNAVFDLEKYDKKKILFKMKEIKKMRDSKQPKEHPNAGSVFKRPKGYYVGPMIEELNLKGYTVGGAQVSKKHGGFIINFNNATGQDVIDVIDHIKSKVLTKYGIELEVEQRIIT